MQTHAGGELRNSHSQYTNTQVLIHTIIPSYWYMTERVMTYLLFVCPEGLESRHYFRKFLSLLQQGIL